MAYLTKEQVVASFKLEYLPHLTGLSTDEKERAWHILLQSLYDDNKISKSQKNTWKFPKKELSL